MVKLNLLPFVLCFCFFNSAAQVNNIKIPPYKKKFDVHVDVLAGMSERGGFMMAQSIFRIPVTTKFKLGAGFGISFDEEKGGSHPVVLLDAMQLLGQKKKWYLNAQLGRGFYKRSFDFPGAQDINYTTTENKEMFFRFSPGRLFNAGPNHTLSLGLYFMSQSYKSYTQGTNNNGGLLNPFSSRVSYTGGGIHIGFTF